MDLWSQGVVEEHSGRRKEVPGFAAAFWWPEAV